MQMSTIFLGKRLSPLAYRRWCNFKANRRGFWSLWIFLFLFVVSLLAEFIANDKPLLVSYDDRLYMPVLNVYQEVEFGGEFELEADYSDPYVQQLIVEKGWILWPIIPFSYDTIDVDLPVPAPSPPSTRHWIGTDDQARDVLARIIYGFRISILFGCLLTFFSSIVGIAVGALQGYFGGRLDLIMQRFIEIWEGLPVLYLLIIMSVVIAPSFFSLLILMLLFSWPGLVAVVRAEFLRTRNFEYIRASRALGVSDKKIMMCHILPNAMVATLTFLPFILSGSVITLTSLDFLGFGLPVGSASLGELLSQGKNNIQAAWLGVSGFLTISIMLSLLVFIGEAIRDAFDPRKLFS